MKPLCAILACSLSLCLCGVAPAFSDSIAGANSDSSEFIYTLEEVVVYGIRTFSGPSMVTEITEEEIQERNAVTVADILRADPGLSVTTGPKAETETKIRGFPARDVLVLVDGRPINSGYYGKVDLSMLPLDNIAKIRVIKGPASVAYGANSMGGVINIVTKNGLETPRTVVETEFGDYQFRKLSVNHSRKVGRWNYWLSGYENYSRGYALSEEFQSTSLEDGGLRGNSSYHKTGVSGKLGFQPSPMSLYALSLGFHWAKKDVPYTIYSFESPAYRTFPSWERLNSALSGNWHLSPVIELKSILFVDAQHDRLIDYSGREMRDDQIVWDSKLENWTVGGSADAKVSAWRNHRFQTGINFKRDLMNKKPDLDEPWETHYIYTGTVYSQDTYQPWTNTELTAGVSYDLFMTEKENSLVSRLCPMASLRQNLPWEVQFRASYANAIRFPVLHQLYSESSGNPDLKAERADKFEIGLERRFVFNDAGRSVSLEAAFFHNELNDLIYRTGGSDRFENIDQATLQGWELRTVLQFSRYLSGDVSYVYINPGVSSGVLLEESSPNKLHILLAGETRFGLKVHYEFSYFDQRTTYRPSWILPQYEVHNVNVSQRLWEHLTVHFRIWNILDTDYEEELGYPMAGRQFFAGLTWTI
jgi:outer membrane cobalamin receptor